MATSKRVNSKPKQKVAPKPAKPAAKQAAKPAKPAAKQAPKPARKTAEPGLKPVRGILVDDEQFFALKKDLKARGGYHGLRKDFVDGCGGWAVLWPADDFLEERIRAIVAEDIPEPDHIQGFEAEYVSDAAARKRKIARPVFRGVWGLCVNRLTACDHDQPLGFFTKETDARASLKAAAEMRRADPRYGSGKQMELGEPEDD